MFFSPLCREKAFGFPAVSAKKIGHPAPFPEELPRRLIHLYSFEADVILDPFAGSGTAFGGYEKQQKLCRLR